MRVEIVLRKGEDPHVYDADSKVEISGDVQTITLSPGRSGSVTLRILKRNEEGGRYVEDGDVAHEIVEADLVYLRGDWDAHP